MAEISLSAQDQSILDTELNDKANQEVITTIIQESDIESVTEEYSKVREPTESTDESLENSVADSSSNDHKYGKRDEDDKQVQDTEKLASNVESKSSIETQTNSDLKSKEEGTGEVTDVSEESITEDDKEDKEDPQTKINTSLNAMIYHTSNESLESYKKQMSSSDTIERLYFDNYDENYTSDMSTPPSAITTPISSPFLRPMSPSVINESISDLLGSKPSSDVSLQRPTVSRGVSFERRITFDTSSDPSSRTLSLTLKAKHPDFKFRRNNKTFLVGFNDNDVSLRALEWLFEELVINGDTIIILEVLDETVHHTIDKKSANLTLSKIEGLNKYSRKLSLVLEITIGKPQKSFKRAVVEYDPVMLIVGTHQYRDASGKVHGKESRHGAFWKSNSMSKYFLQESLVPVIAVNPNHKTEEFLSHPIVDENYFQDWICNLDLSKSYAKKEKRMSLLSSRSSSLARHSESSPLRQTFTNPPNGGSQLSNNRGREVHSDTASRFLNTLSPQSSRGLSPARTLSPFGRFFGKSNK